MRPSGTPGALLFTSLLCLLVPLGGSGQRQQPKEWTWIDRHGHVRSRADLDKILAQHKLWCESHGKSGVPAELSGADLSGANLREAHLTGAYLDSADLTDAHLDGADLTDAHLDGASLFGAHLNGAYLDSANLVGADLTGARLNGASLSDADLTGAIVHSADLSGTNFEPKNLPVPEFIALAQGLELMTYLFNPGPLTQLRKQFQDAGYREQERAITYALNRHDAQPAALRWFVEDTLRRILRGPRGGVYAIPLGSFIEAAFKWVAFDLTCQYGLTPGRPLRLVLWLWLFFSIGYAVFMHWPGPSGIYFVGSRTWRGKSNSQGIQIRPRAIRASKWWKLPFLWLRREWRLLRAAMFFSLMSAFNIGFRDINFGRWLRLLTKREYDLKAVGWARTVAGFQSLLSVYLIALWVLTYFGRPFG